MAALAAATTAANALGTRARSPSRLMKPSRSSPGARTLTLCRALAVAGYCFFDRGWSYGVVARRGGLPRSTVYTLATTRNLPRPPRPATIDALARGLDVPVSVVRRNRAVPDQQIRLRRIA